MIASVGLYGRWNYFTSANSPLPKNSIVAFAVSNEQGQVWIYVALSEGMNRPVKPYALFLTDGVNWHEYPNSTYPAH